MTTFAVTGRKKLGYLPLPMGSAFSQTLRGLAVNRPRTSLAAVGLATAVLVGWTIWFSRAKVAVRAVTDVARLEVEQRAHAVDSPIAGRIDHARFELGRPVKSGEALVELDAAIEQRQLERLRARLLAIQSQMQATERELIAQSRVLGDDERATLAGIDEHRARLAEAEFASAQARDEAERASKLLDAGSLAPAEATRLAFTAAQKRAAADATSLTLETMRRDQQTRGSQGIARVEALRRDLAALDGERTTTVADVRVLEETINKSIVRAPVSGTIGEVAPVNAGMYVHAGDRLFSIVPPGELKAVAEFLPADALGRIRPGQSARLRLQGFPWMQYGTVPATVARVGGELRDGRVRVELAIHVAATSRIPVQHGLPATAEVDVERVTPLHLVLRSIGMALARPSKVGSKT